MKLQVTAGQLRLRVVDPKRLNPDKEIHDDKGWSKVRG